MDHGPDTETGGCGAWEEYAIARPEAETSEAVKPVNWWEVGKERCDQSTLAKWSYGGQNAGARVGTKRVLLGLGQVLQAMTPRAIRYLVIKYLDRAGIHGASVQEMLGHESIETTQIYLGLAKKVQRRTVQEFRCDILPLSL